MSIRDKVFHNKNRAIRIAARTPVVILSPVIFIVALIEAFFIGGFKASLSRWVDIKGLASDIRQGYLT